MTATILSNEEIQACLPGAVRLPPGWLETARNIEKAILAKQAAQKVSPPARSTDATQLDVAVGNAISNFFAGVDNGDGTLAFDHCDANDIDILAREVLTAVRGASPDRNAGADWRKLAIQFDAQRMAAMAHLRAMVKDPAAHAEQASAFIAAPPPQWKHDNPARRISLDIGLAVVQYGSAVRHEDDEAMRETSSRVVAMLDLLEAMATESARDADQWRQHQDVIRSSTMKDMLHISMRINTGGMYNTRDGVMDVRALMSGLVAPEHKVATLAARYLHEMLAAIAAANKGRHV